VWNTASLGNALRRVLCHRFQEQRWLDSCMGIMSFADPERRGDTTALLLNVKQLRLKSGSTSRFGCTWTA
jgi:DNA-directed RNA polymerase alpha subunit